MPPVLGVSNAIVIIRANDVLSRQLQGISGRLARAGAAISQVGLALTASLSFPIAAMAKSAVSAAAEFEVMMARVQAISRESGDAINTVAQNLVNLSTDITKSVDTPKELADAMYQAVQRGYDLVDSQRLVEVSTMAAQASLSDASTTLDAIGSVLLSYGMSVDSAMDVSDMLFRTVDRGNVTFQQLVQQLGDIVPAAYSAGLALEEPLGALSALTLRGIPTAEAATQIKRLIMSLTAPTKGARGAMEEMGIEWGKAALGEKGLLGVIKDINEIVGDNQVKLREIFPNQREYYGYINLMYDLGVSFEDSTKYVHEFAGATEYANKIVSETFDSKLKNLRNNFIAIGMAAAKVLVPPLLDVSNALISVLKSLQMLDPKVQRFMVWMGLAAAAIGPLLIAIGSFVSILTFMLKPVVKVIAVVLKMGKGLLSVAKYFVSFGATILKVIPVIAVALFDAAKMIVLGFVGIASRIGGLLTRVFVAVRTRVLAVMTGLGGVATKIGRVILSALVMPFRLLAVVIAGPVMAAVRALIGLFGALLGVIGQVAVALVRNLIPILTTFLGVIGSALGVVGMFAAILGAALAVTLGGLIGYTNNIINFRDAVDSLAKQAGPIGTLATVLKEIFAALTEADFLGTWYAFRDVTMQLPNPLGIVAKAMVWIARGAVVAKAAFQILFLEIRAFVEAIQKTDWSNLFLLFENMSSIGKQGAALIGNVFDLMRLEAEKKTLEMNYTIGTAWREFWLDMALSFYNLLNTIAIKPIAIMGAAINTVLATVGIFIEGLYKTVLAGLDAILAITERFFMVMSLFPHTGFLYAKALTDVKALREEINKPLRLDPTPVETWTNRVESAFQRVKDVSQSAIEEQITQTKETFRADEAREYYREMTLIEHKINLMEKESETLGDNFRKFGQAVFDAGGKFGATWAETRGSILDVEEQITGQAAKELAALDAVEAKVNGIVTAKAKQARQEALLNWQLARQEDEFEKTANVMKRATREVGAVTKTEGEGAGNTWADAGEKAADAWKKAFEKATGIITDDLDGVQDYIDKLGGLPGESPFGGDPFVPGNAGPFEWVYQLLDIAQNLGTPHEGKDTRKWYQQFYDGMGFTEAVADALATLKDVRAGKWDSDMVSRFMTPEAWAQMGELEAGKLYAEALGQKVAEGVANLPVVQDAILKLAGVINKDGQIVAPDMTAVAGVAKSQLDTALDQAGTQGMLWEKVSQKPPDEVMDFLPTLLSVNSSLQTTIDDNESMLMERGRQLWDKVEAGVIDKAKNSAALRAAIDAMVAESLS